MSHVYGIEQPIGLLVAAKSPCFGIGLEGLVLVNISAFKTDC